MRQRASGAVCGTGDRVPSGERREPLGIGRNRLSRPVIGPRNALRAARPVAVGQPDSAADGIAGRRVVDGQRLLQAASDPFLGWTHGTYRPRRDYFVRQLRDMKGGIDLSTLDGEALAMYGRVCGAVLARGHARAGSAASIAGYLGGSSAFDEAVAEFGVAYADVTERDHAVLRAAIADGSVPATTI